jgi:hypothetical protein
LGLLKAALAGEILVIEDLAGGLLGATGDLAGESSAGSLWFVGVSH